MVKFSVYLNRLVFVMSFTKKKKKKKMDLPVRAHADDDDLVFCAAFNIFKSY